MRSDEMRTVILEVTKGRAAPPAGFSPEMSAYWHEVRAEFGEWLKYHPGSRLVVPDDLPG